MDYTIQGLVFRKMESAPIAGLQKKELKIALFNWHF
jgi:hypothetical protein